VYREAIISNNLNGDNFFVWKNSIKAIIFDCDGTLVDSEQTHFLAWQSALKKKGYQLDKKFYIENFAGIGDFEISRIASDIIGFDCSEESLNHKNNFFNNYLKAGISPISATVEFARCLFYQKEKYKIKLAVASGARKRDILGNLRSLDMESYFDVILSGHDDLSEYHDLEGTNKPKPYVYLKAAKIMGCKPEECVAIEDSRTGVFSARDAGCMTIAVPNHFTQQHDLSYAHIKITSFAGMTVNDFFTMIKAKKSS
jgi:beta-phosphoglucomutase-like phosphatase (HAD superfamily)